MSDIQNSVVCELLVDMINCYIDKTANENDLEEIINKLAKITKQKFGNDIKSWVDWYMSSNEKISDKKVIEIAFRIYKTHVRILNGLTGHTQ